MAARRAVLRALVESIADGSPIDWQVLEAAAPDEVARRRLRRIRLVAEVAAVHRSPVETEPLDSRPASPNVDDGLGRWGHLVLLEKIGEGSFGEVFRARDPWLDREVALKRLKPLASSDVPTARVLREAQTLARVRHPNVVLVHGADVHDGRVGMWMELLRGRTLEQLLASQGPFGAAETVVAGQELCRALAAVHAVGLAHCDVKTANVMRESGGRLVLMDFGAGQRRDLEATGPLELAGTPLYLAPELFTGAGATARSDIYSLGVLLYRLVTGYYPVVAESFDDLRAAHDRRDHLRLRDMRPDLPDAFVNVVERALSPDPERRYATAGEMQLALAHAVGSERGDERTPTPSPPRWPPRRGLLWAIAVVGLSVLLGLAIWRPNINRPPLGGPGPVSFLAVLPFQNLSTDPADAYLASALPMELTARLGQVGALKVVPWTFMRRFDGAGQQALHEVAARTGADAIVEGSVQRVPAADGSPGPVQVRVQIFAASTGNLLWSSSFERGLGDFLVVQAQIAREVATRLRVVPAARDEILLSRSREVPSQAMEDYLNARQLLEIQMNLQGAATLFQRAVDRAPVFAEAYVGLAWCRALESGYFGAVPSDVALQRTLVASDRAIEIDPEMPEGWAVRAFARFALEGNWSAAESDFQRALELGPTSAEVLQSYSNYLSDRARHAEAIETSRKAEDRAPFSVAASRQVAWAYYMARQFDDAIRQARRTLEIEPGYAPARTVLARALLFAGRPAEGISELQAVGRDYEHMLALGYAMAGRREDATRLLTTILSQGYDRAAAPYQVALVHAALGNQSQAVDALEAAYTAKDASLTELGVDPMLDPLRDNPRFRALLDKVSSRR